MQFAVEYGMRLRAFSKNSLDALDAWLGGFPQMHRLLIQSSPFVSLSEKRNCLAFVPSSSFAPPKQNQHALHSSDRILIYFVFAHHPHHMHLSIVSFCIFVRLGRGSTT